MTTQSQTAGVVLAVYATEAEAKAALETLKEMERNRTIELIEAAVVHKDHEGKVHVDDSADVGTKGGLARGAIVGGVLGVIFPPSILVSAVAGGAVGGLYGKLHDKGFSNKDLAAAGEELDAGEAGLVAVLVDKFINQIETGLSGYAKLSSHLLSAEESTALMATTTED